MAFEDAGVPDEAFDPAFGLSCGRIVGGISDLRVQVSELELEFDCG